jgi:MoaA/NifB/PqqE/SkfB family radical SAM enzyme
VFNCRCSGHVPFPLGYAKDFNTFDEMFKSDQSTKHQESVANKNFEYCTTQFCGIEGGNINIKPNGIYVCLEIDNSCNLSCPSCRERMVFVNDKDILAKLNAIADKVCQWIKSTDKIVTVEFCGGETFVSLVYTDLLLKLLTYHNARVVVRSNGLLIKTHVPKIEDRIMNMSLSISIDASSKEVYEKVRRGGKWDTLLQNLEYVKQLTIKYPDLRVTSTFVVQQENINDIIPFVEFSKQYNLDPHFSVLEDWGSWNNYEEHCIHLPTSTQYSKFQDTVTKLKDLVPDYSIQRMAAWA